MEKTDKFCVVLKGKQGILVKDKFEFSGMVLQKVLSIVLLNATKLT